MKRIFRAVFAGFLFLSITAYASTNYKEQIENIQQEYNIETEEIMDSDIQSVLNYLSENIKSVYKKPLELSLKVAVVIFICALSKSLNNENSLVNITDNISVLAVFLLLVSPVREIIGYLSENLMTVKNFMVSFIPVFSGVIMASGEFFTSTVYAGIFLTAIIAVSGLCIDVILPSIRIYMAVFISDALSPYIRLKSLGEFYLKAIKNIMKISVSAICFILTIQTTISSGKDTLAVKAGKIITGTAIPVIGASLQDAVSSIYAGMETIKSYAGMVGVSAVVMIFLPSVISLAIYWIYTYLLYILGDIMDTQSICKCIKGFVNIIELMLSVTALYMVMFVFSITIMLAVTNGV